MTISETDLLNVCHGFSAMAESGDPAAMLELSRCYYNGTEPGFDRDLVQAREWLESSAKRDHGPAQVSLAAFILLDAQDDASRSEALDWARKAKASNQPGAATIMVLSTHKSRGEPLGASVLDQIESDARAGYLPAAFALFAQNFVGDTDASGKSQSSAFRALQYRFTDFGLEDAKRSCADLASETSILVYAFEEETLRAAGEACQEALDRVTQEAETYPLVPRPES
ncbi:MAG: hypothetical protein AAFY15_00375 [Cyanobacteria bacterium J06648_11]